MKTSMGNDVALPSDAAAAFPNPGPSLQDAKAGDSVVLISSRGFYGCDAAIRTVERATATQLIVASRRFNRRGHEVGQRYGRTHLEPVNASSLATIAESVMAQRVLKASIALGKVTVAAGNVAAVESFLRGIRGAAAPSEERDASNPKVSKGDCL